MTQNELKDAVRRKTPAVYFLCGEEEYLKQYWLREFRKSILGDASLAAFNHIRFEDEDIDVGALTEAAVTPPVMDDYKLVEWHLAKLSSLGEKELSALAELAARVKADGYAVVVFYVGDGDLDLTGHPKRLPKVATALSMLGQLCVFSRSTDAALSAWLERHFMHLGISVTPAFTRAMIAQVGHDMQVLSNETEKIAYYLLSNGSNTADTAVLQLVSSTNVECDAFALSNAILESDGAAAFRALYDMKRRRMDPGFILSSVARVYADLVTAVSLAEEGLARPEIAKKMKLHEYKVGLYLTAAQKKSRSFLDRALALCRAADVAAKSGGSTGYGAIERLIGTVTARTNA